MTISTQNRTAGPYAGTGGVVSYPFSFKIFKPSDLSVFRTQLSVGVDVELVLNTDYAVVLNGNQDTNPGGNVVLTSPLAVGFTLTLTSRVEYLQPTDLTNQGGFYPRVINAAFDRLTILVQQALGIAGRAIKIPLSDGAINTTLPGKEQRKGRVLAFDETTGAPVLGPNVQGGAAAPYIGETAPLTPFNGMRWYNPNVPITYVYYKDGDSGQWVEEASRPVSDGSRLPSLSYLPLDATHGDMVNVVAFYGGWAAMASLPRGGGTFVWNAQLSKTAHNGVTVFDPLGIAVWDGTRPNLSSLLGWNTIGTGCWVRQNPTYHIFEAGGGDGIHDDSQVLQRVLDVAPPSSTVSIAGAKVLLDNGITVTDLRTLAGDWKNPDIAGPANAQYYQVATSSIILNQAGTIRLGQSSSVRNMLVYRKGMTFPTDNDLAFAGTAFDAISSTASLSELLVMGFNNLFKGSGQRYVIDRVFGDNRNGIEIVASPDVSYVSRCHMWPFSANTNIYPSNAVNRAGSAYKFKDVGDWIKVSECFSYAYLTGFELENVNSMTLLSCSADHNFPNSQVGISRGFWIKGNCQDIQLQNPQAAAQIIGIEVQTTNSQFNTTIMGGALWSNRDHSILVTSGSTRVGGGITLRNAPYALGVASTDSFVDIDDALIKEVVNPFVVPVGTTKVRIGENIRYEGIQDGILNTINVGLPAVSIPLSGTIDIPYGAKVITLTGTNQLTFIRNYVTGQRITLIFNDEGVVANSGGSGVHGIRLQGGVPFYTKIGSTLTLMHNGDQWFEVSRSMTTNNIQGYLPVVTGSTTAGTCTYTTQDGKFYEIGELVFFTVSVTYSGHTGSGGLRVSLPHTLSNFGERVALNIYYSNLSVGAGRECVAFVGTAGNVLAIRAADPSGAGVTEFFDAAATINISGFYRRA